MITAHLDTTAYDRATSSFTRLLDPRVASALVAALNRDVLPAALQRTPKKTGRLSASTRIGTGGRVAFITQKTPYAAIIEFGGTRRDTIRPKTAKALRTPSGPRAKVTGPRRYKPSHHLERTVNATREQVETTTCELVMEFAASVGLDARAA